MNDGEPCVLGDEAGDGMWIDEVRSLVIVPFWREAACNMRDWRQHVWFGEVRSVGCDVGTVPPYTRTALPCRAYNNCTHSPGA